MATVIARGGSAPRSAGARMLVHPDGHIEGTIGGGALEHRGVAACLEALETGRPQRLAVDLVRDLGMCCGGRVEVYVEPLFPREPFFVFGAGHVAHALVPLLKALDFEVTVIDDRVELNTPERFPEVVRHLGDPLAFAECLGRHPGAYRLVVTHDHRLDQDLVEALLPQPAAWTGMIGSRAKAARFRTRLVAGGLDAALLDRLASPVGLDLGAETPAEIAVSIAAEVVRVRRGSEAPPLPLWSASPRG